MQTYITAALNEDIDTLQRLAIRHKNSTDDLSRTALMIAAQNNKIKSVNVLKSGEFRSKTTSGETALMLAACNGVISSVEALAEIEMKMQDSQGYTALMFASFFGFTKCVNLLLQEAGKYTRSGINALSLSIINDNIKIVKLLDNVETLDNKVSILMLAAYSGSIKTVKQYIHQSGQVDVSNKTALIYAIESQNIEIIQLLIDEQSIVSPLISAILTNNLSIIDLFKDCKNTVDNNGRTALMHACTSKNTQLIQDLISEAGAQDNNGISASMILAQNGMIKEFKMLFSEENQLVDCNGLNMLHYAAMSKNIDLVKYLQPMFELAFDVNGRGSQFNAIQSDNIEVCKLLGVQIDKNGISELMYSAINDAISCCEYYIDQANRKSLKRKLAIDYAIEHDSVNVYQILLQHENPSQNVLLMSSVFNSVKILRLVREIAATGSSSLLKFKISDKSIKIIKNSVDSIAHHYEEFPDGVNSLFLAIHCGSSGAVRLLCPVLETSQFRGYSPLMYAVLIEADIDLKAWKLLVDMCHSVQTKDIDGFVKGTTALMLAVMKQKLNLEVITMIYQYEKDLVNGNSENAKKFAEIGERKEVIALFE
ncbi:Ankyrin repeat-containing protein [Spironucleus salmonicida]|uniref:Ankyrin repeat-containing protein n=1 Tax=Spironucleus salmonicida TaxID=348837 RepID=V6LLZ0_9EUKA|nr:Ankyrin repeat-containing protein [Spironucleus salmonicida]|eukprot:EST41724.1 Ankyrin repeat-containing protein [Spironucleus salmonicida]